MEEEIKECIKNIKGHARNIIEFGLYKEFHPSRAHAKDIIKWIEKLESQWK